ncbi:MAG: lytic murein transglycosylase [Desulfarculus sp.]|nr:lytic murein transglycosylase [Desulfarculus sp.]
MLLAGLLLAAPASALAALDPVLAPLKAYLVSQGQSPGQAEALLGGQGVHFEAKLLAGMLSRKERPRDYRQFLLPESVARCRRFAQQQAPTLAAARGKSGVPPEVVVAILYIESGLGSFTGKWPVVGVLASQAVLDTPLALRRLAQVWPKKQLAYLKSPQCQERFAKRAAWARGELLGLIKIAKQQGLSPLSIKGSPAGALGMPQFMPTSLLQWGADGNQDGRVDLNHTADAIFSVANYLAAHGWRPGLDRQGQYQVVYTYNHSQAYVDTVLDLAQKIK